MILPSSKVSWPQAVTISLSYLTALFTLSPLGPQAQDRADAQEVFPQLMDDPVSMALTFGPHASTQCFEATKGRPGKEQLQLPEAPCLSSIPQHVHIHTTYRWYINT